jgi:hypothetical protein
VQSFALVGTVSPEPSPLPTCAVVQRLLESQDAGFHLPLSLPAFVRKFRHTITLRESSSISEEPVSTNELCSILSLLSTLLHCLRITENAGVPNSWIHYQGVTVFFQRAQEECNTVPFAHRERHHVADQMHCFSFTVTPCPCLSSFPARLIHMQNNARSKHLRCHEFQRNSVRHLLP